MTVPSAAPRPVWASALTMLLLLAIGVGAGAWWQARRIDGAVRTVLLDHPEILPEAVERLRQKQALAALGPIRAQLETPFPGAVLGNPRGARVLVEFADFSCGYCRRSEGDVQALIAANPDLKVVVRQLPIIGPMSEPAARMGLAAAAQGKYAAFHHAMYTGPAPDRATIAAAAHAAGVEAAAAAAFARSARADAELRQNLAFAHQLNIEGTPTWVAGNDLFTGAVGRDRLQAALNALPGAAKPAS